MGLLSILFGDRYFISAPNSINTEIASTFYVFIAKNIGPTPSFEARLGSAPASSNALDIDWSRDMVANASGV